MDVQRWDGPQVLVGDSQPLPAGRQIRTVVDRARIVSINSAAASRRCSQLSKTDGCVLPSMASAMLSAETTYKAVEWLTPEGSGRQYPYRIGIGDSRRLPRSQLVL